MTNQPTICMLVFNSVVRDSRVLKEASSLTDAGYRVVILGMAEGQEDVAAGQWPFEVRLVRLRSKHLRSKLALVVKAAELGWRYLLGLWKVRCDVIHCHDIAPMPFAALVARLRGLPIVYDSHELEHDRNLPRASRLYSRYCEKLFIHAANEIIVSDGEFRAGVMRERHSPRAPFTYVMNCPPRSDSIPSEWRGELRRYTGIPDSHAIAVYVGQVSRGRGMRQVLEALGKLENISLVVVGSVVDPRFRTDIEELGLQSRVHAIGPFHYADVIKYVAGADMGLCLIENVSLSYYLSTPTKMFDYMSARVPMIVSDFPAMAAIVAGDGTGLLGIAVDPDSPQELANAMHRLATLGDSEREAMRIRLERQHLERFNWPVQQRKLLEVYGRVLPLAAKGMEAI